jgi:hypothetical protein
MSPQSWVNVRIYTYLQSEFIAALVALYGPQPVFPVTAAPELTKTTLPVKLLLRK